MEKHADYYAPQVEALKAGKSEEGENESSETATTGQQESGKQSNASTDADYIDVDSMTDKDVEEYLNRLDAEDAHASKS
jgi:hypothetical protein